MVILFGFAHFAEGIKSATLGQWIMLLGIAIPIFWAIVLYIGVKIENAIANPTPTKRPQTTIQSSVVDNRIIRFDETAPVPARVRSFNPDLLPRDLNKILTLDEQNKLFVLYDQMGIINGTPGSWDDEYVRGKIDQIMGSNLSNDQKYFVLDTLDAGTQNNHAYGLAADVRNEISRAIDKTLGY